MRCQHGRPTLEAGGRNCFKSCPARLCQREVLAAEAGAHGAVVEHCHACERLYDLVRACNAKASDVIRLLPPDIRSIQDDPAGVCGENTVDEIEDRGFAGAIRPDQAKDFSTLDSEAQVTHSMQPAKAFVHLVELQQCPHSSTFWVRGNRR